jgi:hypothetical protein
MLAAHIPNPLPKSVLTFNLSWTHAAGRLIWATVLLLIGIGIVMFLARRPKSAEPATWAQSMVGALLAFSLMVLAYGTVPHEWIIFANSYLKWGTAKYLMTRNHVLRFDINLQAVNDAIAAGIYVVMLGLNVYLFAIWQKRPVRAPESSDESAARQPAGTSAFNRPVTSKA